MKKFTGLTDRRGKRIYDGDILKVDLGMRMYSADPKSNFLLLEVYKDGYTWMVTAVGGWIPIGYSDWTLSGTLEQGANKDVRRLTHPVKL